MPKRKRSNRASKKQDRDRKRRERERKISDRNQLKAAKSSISQTITNDEETKEDSTSKVMLNNIKSLPKYETINFYSESSFSNQIGETDWCADVAFSTFHQGSDLFTYDSRGRQCTCIALAMLLQVENNRLFTTETIDMILIQGDMMYKNTVKSLQDSGRFINDYLLFEELPTSVTISDQTYNIIKMDEINGVVLHEIELETYTLEEGINEWFEYANFGLILTNGMCSAIFKKDNYIYFFDSHSHDGVGMSCPDGNAILIKFRNITSLVAYLYQFYASINALKNIQFQILPISIETEVNPEGNFQVVKPKSLSPDGINQSEEICNNVNISIENELKHLLTLKSNRDKKRKRYRDDEVHREELKAKSVEKYRDDEFYREQLKEKSVQKYRDDEVHRGQLKEKSVEKYRDDEVHREQLKEKSVEQYRDDEVHREQLKEKSVEKYRDDDVHREKLKSASIVKYRTSEAHRESLKKKIQQKRIAKKVQSKNIHTAAQSVKEKFASGPECICSVCHKLRFRRQVLICKPENYNKKSTKVSAMANKCITYTYFHKCSVSCESNCDTAKTPRSKLWICYTCHRKILRAEMPCDAYVNNLQLQQMPNELRDLNKLEKHLIALRIPFMKMVSLPKGGQYGVTGPVTGIPCNIENTTKTLPRSEDQSKLIQVKLKRKLPFKGHYEYQFVSTAKLENALKYLMKYNKWYKDVTVDSSWQNPVQPGNKFQEVDMDDEETNTSTPDANNDEPEDRLCGPPVDTCLQPVDIGQEVLDQYFDNIFCVAPGEGKTPVRLLQEQGNEAMSFPAQFPLGNGSFTDQRNVKLSVYRYFHSRLLNADNRFSSDTNYIFYAQFLSELHQIVSSVSIALRKGDGKCFGAQVNRNFDNLKDTEFLKKILKSDQGYKFLKPVRGTPPYWQTTLKDLFAMLRQLGIPTWFCSFSSADLRWEEVIKTVFRQQGITKEPSTLDWMEKCEILRRNPITAVQMFDNRWHIFLHEVLLSNANPIGHINDYFFRVEFQMRGSPHVHALFWVEGAPLLDTDSDQIVCTFIDKYVSCSLPSEDDDPELSEIVHSVQKHSNKHSASCRKKGTECRFNFPRPPSDRVFISRPREDTEHVLSRDNAVLQLQMLWHILDNCDVRDMQTVDVLQKAGLTQDQFECAMNVVTKRNSIQIKRGPTELWINNYNPHLLRIWNANMDIQYVTDAYSCMMYIVSYISKAEREMGIVLEQARKEALEGNMEAQQSMKKIGGVYLHHREISAQEASYRVCGLKLKGCSRKVQFVPVGENIVKMSKPLKLIQSMPDDSEGDDIWMPTLKDRYQARPVSDHFEKMCFATFCSEYRIVYSSQLPSMSRKNIHVLQNNLGFIQKRSKTENAIIRYPRFSVSKVPEQYYLTQLQLFLPHRTEDQLKPESFTTYHDFYKSGAVKLTTKSQLTFVHDIVEENRLLYDKCSDELDEAEKLMEKVGPLEDAWAQICPETEAERLECINLKEVSENQELNDEEIPDLLNSSHEQRSDKTLEIQPNIPPRHHILSMLRTLNTKQREIFFKIRQFCIDLVGGNQRDPIHLFITGGAGTGKSHLIRCIYYECNRLLAPILPNPDDVSILLLAPTGTAAFNIGGNTIHSGLSIGRKLTIPCIPLSDEKINTLRAKLSSLQIVIIDEISMVGKNLLEYIHDRLKQIKKTSHEEVFGNVSIIAVGDFFQLPPVKGKSLYQSDPSRGRDLWLDYFEIVNLDEIMRQKDDVQFAQLLNRIRVRTKVEPINACDIELLKSRQIQDYQQDTLHAFATNAEVKSHNDLMLEKSGEKVISITAQDLHKDPKSGKMKICDTPYRTGPDYLPECLNIALNSRVMLVRNVDIADGLVNGAVGTVLKILQIGHDFPAGICIKFDNPKVGIKAKQATPSSVPSGTVLVKVHEEGIHVKHVVRRQFPVVLCWGCTIHKTQGLTTDHICANFDKVCRAGMAYVVLSRATTLNGLYIQTLNLDSIFCDQNIKKALMQMKTFPLNQQRSHAKGTDTLHIVYHNTQGLLQHKDDLQEGTTIIQADIICFTETWLQNNVTAHIDSFIPYLKSRFRSFDESHKMFKSLKAQMHGGVGIYSSTKLEIFPINLQTKNLEFVAVSYKNLLAIVTVYRPNSYPVSLFCDVLTNLLSELNNTGIGSVIIVGDFNENLLLHNCSILHTMQNEGYTQLIHFPTTEAGTLIDHVYIKGISQENIYTSIHNTYYSFHDAIDIFLNT